MAQSSTREVKIFRYDPAAADEGHFDSYKLEIPDESTTTILDVLLRVQREQDPSVAFRYACRVNMCGSCGMVINGKDALACKTNVSNFAAGEEITLRPLNHFPVIRDLVVDMEPFFQNPALLRAQGRLSGAGDDPARLARAQRHWLGDRVHCLRMLRLQLHHVPLP